MYDEVLARLKKAYAAIMGKIGDPLDEGTLYGPMHSKQVRKAFILFLSVSVTVCT